MTAYYVDGTSGSEANDGLSAASPKLYWSGSIGRANGDVLNLRAGTTIQMTVADGVTGNYTIQPYGDGPKPIVTMVAYATSRFSCNASSKGPVFRVRGIKFVRIDTGDIPAYGDNIPINSVGAETLIAEDCEIEGKFAHGIRVGYGDNAIVRRNKITGPLNSGIYVGITGQQAPSYGRYEANRIDVSSATNDGITLHDGTGTGIGNVIIGNAVWSGVENAVDVQGMYAGTHVAFNRLYGGPLNGTSGSGNALLTSLGQCIVTGNVFDAYNTTCLQFGAVGASGSRISRNLVLGPTIKRVLAAVPQMVQHSAANINQMYLGNTFVGRCTENPGASMFALNSQTPTGVFKNNVVIKSPLDTYQAFFWVGNAGPVGEFDNNIMVMPSLGTAQYCNRSWSSFNSTFSAHANNSSEVTASPLDAQYRPLIVDPMSSSPVVGKGWLDGCICDADGVLLSMPPPIGAYEYVTQRPTRTL